MTPDAWNFDELEAARLEAEAAPRAPLPDWIATYPTRGPKLLRPATSTRVVTRRPRPLAARVTEVRALRRDGLITRGEARELLGLEPESAGRKVLRALRRELRRWRVTWR